LHSPRDFGRHRNQVDAVVPRPADVSYLTVEEVSEHLRDKMLKSDWIDRGEILGAVLKMTTESRDRSIVSSDVELA
jgi:hypothetical protein